MCSVPNDLLLTCVRTAYSCIGMLHLRPMLRIPTCPGLALGLDTCAEAVQEATAPPSCPSWARPSLSTRTLGPTAWRTLRSGGGLHACMLHAPCPRAACHAATRHAPCVAHAACTSCTASRLRRPWRCTRRARWWRMSRSAAAAAHSRSGQARPAPPPSTWPGRGKGRGEPACRCMAPPAQSAYPACLASPIAPPTHGRAMQDAAGRVRAPVLPGRGACAGLERVRPLRPHCGRMH